MNYIITFWIAFCVFMLIRTEVAFRNQTIIGEAVFAYSMDCINNGTYYSREVYYEDIEPYASTMWRLWDFGYTRILPPEKYEIIRPYIKE